MKQSLSTLLVALLIVAGLTGWSLWERHEGALAVEARVRAESLLVAAKTAQDSILRVDSVRSAQADSAQNALRRSLEAARAHYAASRRVSDSLATAALRDSLVPRDTVGLLISAFQGERAQAQAQIALLEADTALLNRTITGKDSTIAALNHSLDGERQQLATALKPQGPSLLGKALDLGIKVLAVRGALAFALGK